MLVQRWWWAVQAAYKLRGYQPKRVTLRAVMLWARQFPKGYRNELVRLVAKFQFVSEEETARHLVELNRKVLNALKEDGLSEKNVIYIATDTAGSSSGVMLDLLRRRANLERAGAKFLHSGEGEAIQRKTMQLQNGAIIYVDDFAGTGKQFSRSRKRVAEYITGGFSEFFLVPCICEEAIEQCKKIGVQVESGLVHMRRQRPLHSESVFFSSEKRNELLRICREKIGAGKPVLGFNGLATNVVLYRNAPNTTPLVFRGNLGQQPVHGILPRFDDL